MTVVCALKDGDDLFLAADSSLGGLPVKTRVVTKLEYYNLSNPLIWATSGDESIGDEFSDWLKSQISHAPGLCLSWETFKNGCQDDLARRNGLFLRVRQQNHVPVNPENDYSQVLVVGYINGLPEILHIDFEGCSTFHLRAGRTFATIGGGRYHAATVYEVLLRKGILASSGLEAIKEVTEIAADLSPLCALPISVAKATKQGVMLL